MKLLSFLLAFLGLLAIAVGIPAAPINNGVVAREPPDSVCPPGKFFCDSTAYVDEILFCPLDGTGWNFVCACAADERCVGQVVQPEVQPRCVKQTTTIALPPGESLTTSLALCLDSGSTIAPTPTRSWPPARSVYSWPTARSVTMSSETSTPVPVRGGVPHESIAISHKTSTPASTRSWPPARSVYSWPTARSVTVSSEISTPAPARGGVPHESNIMSSETSTPASTRSWPPARSIYSWPTARSVTMLSQPTQTSDLSENVPNSARDTAGASDVYCGFCINTQGFTSELRASGVCNNLPDGETYASCSDQYCGLCVIWSGMDCQGDIIHWGGPGAGSYNAQGGQSHYCM